MSAVGLRRGDTRARLGFLVGLVAVGLSAACSSGSTVIDDNLTAATTATASFQLVKSSGRLSVLSGAGESLVRDEGRIGADNRTVVAGAVGANAVGVVDGAWLGLIGPDGSARTVACRRCRSVMAGGNDVVVLRDSQADDLAFEIVRFDAGLGEQHAVTARRMTERTSPDAEENNDAELLAANATTVWVAYTDRFGFVRGGSRTIAAYSNDGRLIRSTHVLGTIYAHAVSADGRFLAIANGGSGGACVTDSSIDVIDLTAMRGLDAEPRIPVRARLEAAPDDVPSLNFTTEQLYWNGSVAVAVGITSRGNDAVSGCDREATTWVRKYDPSTQRFTDTKTGRNTDIAVGPACGDGWHRDKTVVITSSTGTVRRVDDLLYAPPPPAGCGEQR
ncbi:hypothetical protein OHA18_38760 [Kribbella sp. NBC_00709]|uniref:hypothetical protein n=1 Tax=Kribbella sp. NBC_00709 TaxID=2975972 RepID=UPI002E2959D5|nr:hypothetical protein [Kribbella sp. NBC_00709]